MDAGRRLRIVIADDHEVVRGGLKTLLESASDLEVVAEAATGLQAVERIVALQPDVALLDVSMPGMNGIEAVRLLRRKAPAVRLVVFSMHSMAELVSAAVP